MELRGIKLELIFKAQKAYEHHSRWANGLGWGGVLPYVHNRGYGKCDATPLPPHYNMHGPFSGFTGIHKLRDPGVPGFSAHLPPACPTSTFLCPLSAVGPAYANLISPVHKTSRGMPCAEDVVFPAIRFRQNK